MNNKFEINEILEAVDIFLNKKKDKQVKFINESKSEKPLKLVNEIQAIEKKIGRTKSKRNHPRICDIDIIDFKGLNLKVQFNGQNIVTPHPRMHKRNFVIFPLYELNKTWVHPKTRVNIHNIINQFKDLGLSDIRIV